MDEEEDTLAYWMRWQVAICALIAVLPMVAAVFLIWRTGRQHLRASDLWAPCWREISPFWLLAYRGLVFLAMSWLLIQTVLIDGAESFYFYTQWTFMLVNIYFAVGTLLSAHGCWLYSRKKITESREAEGRLKDDLIHNNDVILNFKDDQERNALLSNHHDGQEHSQRAGFWGYVIQIIYQTCGGAVMLTDVVFWGLLVPFLSNEYFRLNMIKVCMHSLNAVFLLIDTILNSLPFPWFGMAYFVIWSFIYTSFQWVLHACDLTWWPYTFMDLSTPWSPVWYLAIALVHIPCFGAYYVVAKDFPFLVTRPSIQTRIQFRLQASSLWISLSLPVDGPAR